MNPEEMEKAMMKNILKKTGKGLKDWVKIVTTANLENKAKIVNFLKTKYSIDHFYSHLITKKSSL
tara:strand:+ start:238 stop:432 length:195 start_codon:yes stop_codon:yes gene_type:complete